MDNYQTQKKWSVAEVVTLAIIALCAIATRMWDYGALPYTHDEFSALFRTEFDSLAELLRGGVVETDTHPPLTQVFLWLWTKLFGYEHEWLVKLPFTLMGIGGLVFLYLSARRLFSRSAALVILAFASTMQLFVRYSQIARPYIAGFFLVMAMLYILVLMFQNPGRRFWLHASLYALCAALAAYNHHFSALTAAVLAVVALFFAKKELIGKILIADAMAVVLYLPNMYITMAQLKIGGLGWLGTPGWDFGPMFVGYMFHFSFAVGAVALALCLYAFIKGKGKAGLTIASLAVFMIVLAVGFFYSRLVDPVIQYSCMIFAAPFLLFFLFGRLPDMKWLVELVTIVVILGLDIATLYLHRDFYHLQYHNIYYAIPADMIKANEEHTGIYNLVTYDNKIGRYCFAHIGSDNIDATHIDNLRSTAEIVAVVREATKTCDYLYLGIRSNEQPEVERVIMDYFPEVMWENDYFGGVTKLFRKGIETREIFYSTAFDDQVNTKPIEIPLEKYDYDKNDFIDIVADVQTDDPQGCQIVAELKKNGKQYYYYSNNLKDASLGESDSSYWRKAYLSLKLSDIVNPCSNKGVTLKVTLYGAGNDTIRCRYISFGLRKGNQIIYKLNEP